MYFQKAKYVYVKGIHLIKLSSNLAKNLETRRNYQQIDNRLYFDSRKI